MATENTVKDPIKPFYTNVMGGVVGVVVALVAAKKAAKMTNMYALAGMSALGWIAGSAAQHAYKKAKK